MSSLIQQLLGADWHRLPAGLQAHYQPPPSVEEGYLDIDFPRWMKPYLWLLHRMGALVHRTGQQVSTRVDRDANDGRHSLHRTMRFADGHTMTFHSYCVASGAGRLIEYVNPYMGLEMSVCVKGAEIHYHGVRYILALRRWRLGLPEWLVLGHTTIVERARPDGGFDMDFRLTHPLLGRVFRYSGSFVCRSA